MKSLENITKQLQAAADKNEKGDVFGRENDLLQAFVQLEMERLKFCFCSKYDLNDIGNELNNFTSSLATCLFQFTVDQGNIDRQEWNSTINIRIETLEHYIIKILAIAQILMTDENKDIPIKICGISDVEELECK